MSVLRREAKHSRAPGKGVIRNIQFARSSGGIEHTTRTPTIQALIKTMLDASRAPLTWCHGLLIEAGEVCCCTAGVLRNRIVMANPIPKQKARTMRSTLRILYGGTGWLIGGDRGRIFGPARTELVLFDADGCARVLHAHDAADRDKFEQTAALQYCRPVHRKFDALARAQALLSGESYTFAADVEGFPDTALRNNGLMVEHPVRYFLFDWKSLRGAALHRGIESRIMFWHEFMIFWPERRDNSTTASKASQLRSTNDVGKCVSVGSWLAAGRQDLISSSSCKRPATCRAHWNGRRR